MDSVILIGGTSGAGKTTLGKALAKRLDVTSLSIDDLMIAAQCVTTLESHPGLHVMKSPEGYQAYFTDRSVDQLCADATVQHEAVWPVVEEVVRRKARLGEGVVIDGWHMRPGWVNGLDLPNVHSFWLVANPEVLEEREHANRDWLNGSSNPDLMLQNFLGRSLWYNDLIRTEATNHGMSLLEQTGTVSVEEFVARVVRYVEALA